MVGDETVLGDLHADLVRAGVFTNVVTHPAVRRKGCRLRLNVMAAHTREDLDFAAEVLVRLGRK